MHMVSRLAPNLKEVTLVRTARSVIPSYLPLLPREGLSQEDGPISTKDSPCGSLKYFRICGFLIFEKRMWSFKQLIRAFLS